MVLLPTLPQEVAPQGLPQQEEEEQTFLLPTLQVKVHGPTQIGTIRGLLTWASDYCLLSEQAWRKFDLPLQNASVSSIRNVTGTVIEVLGLSRVRLSPHYDENDITTMDVVVVRNIHQRVTTSAVHPVIRENLANMQLADPFFDVPGEIDILFGAPATPKLMKCGNRSVYGSACHAMQTSMGWIVLGRAPVQENPQQMAPLR